MTNWKSYNMGLMGESWKFDQNHVLKKILILSKKIVPRCMIHQIIQDELAYR